MEVFLSGASRESPHVSGGGNSRDKVLLLVEKRLKARTIRRYAQLLKAVVAMLRSTKVRGAIHSGKHLYL